MQLQVSTEVEPAVFDESAVSAFGARVVHRVHIGWLTLELDSGRLADLRACRGVLGTLVVTSCGDRPEQLPPGIEWGSLAEADAYKLVGMRLDGGRARGHLVALRLTAVVRQLCFVRCHRTEGLDIAVTRADAAAPGGRRLLASHSDGLRDHSRAGMHDWPAGTTRELLMWVGHLPPGAARAEAGFVDGFIRVEGKPRPFSFQADLTLG